MRLPTETEIEASHLYESLIRFMGLTGMYGEEKLGMLKKLIIRTMMQGVMEDHELAFSAAAIELIEASQRENS